MQERKTGVLISSRDIELPKEDKNSKCEFAAFIDDKAKKQDCMRRDLADWIGIDSERFRKIVNKSNPTKKRDCIIACGFALRLNSGETCDALFMYNFPRLDDGLKREEYISTLLDEQASKKVLFWSLEDVNSRLRTMGFPELDVIAHRRGRKAVNPINPPQRYRIDGVCIESCLAEHVFDNRLSSLATEYSPDQFRVFAKIRLTDVWMCKSYEIIAEPDGHYSRIDYPIESHECLHSYTSLEETGEMRALYESAQGYAQRELAKKALVLKDTRNYRDRISACVIENSLHIFTETYNYDMPELQEYFLLDYADGEFQFSVSEESRFMEFYLSPDDYEKYYGVASQRGEVSFSSEEELEKSITLCANWVEQAIKRERLHSFRKMKKKIVELAERLNRDIFILNPALLADNDVDLFEQYGVSRGEPTSLKEDDLYKGFALGLRTLEEIEEFREKYGSLDVSGLF